MPGVGSMRATPPRARGGEGAELFAEGRGLEHDLDDRRARSRCAGICSKLRARRILRDGEPAGRLDRAQALGPVGRSARQDDADVARAPRTRASDIETGRRSAVSDARRPSRIRRTCARWISATVVARGHHGDRIGEQAMAARRVDHREDRRPREQAGQLVRSGMRAGAGARRRRARCRRGSARNHLSQRVEPPGGGANGDHAHGDRPRRGRAFAIAGRYPRGRGDPERSDRRRALVRRDELEDAC